MEHDDILEDLLSWQDVSASSSSYDAEDKHLNSNNSINKLDIKNNKKRMEYSANKKCGLQPSAISVNVRANSAPPLSSLSAVQTMEKITCNEHNITRASSISPHWSSSSSSSSTTEISQAIPSSTSQMLSIPRCVQEKLFDYQVEGIQWMYKRHYHARACLLADEMGLGKTIQVCVLLRCLYVMNAINTTLIVMPPTLINMWQESLQSWGSFASSYNGPLSTIINNNNNNDNHHDKESTPNVAICVIHGQTKNKREALWHKMEYCTSQPIIILTSYGVLRQDVHCIPARVMLDYLILDEAHLIKDASTHSFKSVMQLSARHKIALTGTPFMNSFEDIWSIFHFLDGSILHHERASFRQINTTLLQGNEKDASVSQKRAAEVELRKLQSAIAPYMLRREKASLQHAVQTTKHEMVVWVQLSSIQRMQYETFLASKEVMMLTQESTSSSMEEEREEQLEEQLEELLSTPSHDEVSDMYVKGVEEVEGEYQQEAISTVNKKEIKNVKKKRCKNSSNKNGGGPLLLLTTLTQICNHPWLGLTEAGFRAAIASPFSPLQTTSIEDNVNNNNCTDVERSGNECNSIEENIHNCNDNTETIDWNEWMGDIWSGSKLSVALHIITRALNDHRRILVFSRSKRLLDMLSIILHLWLIPFCRLDGEVLPEQRQILVNKFNGVCTEEKELESSPLVNANVMNDSCSSFSSSCTKNKQNNSYLVCLLTTQVGGLGLTFTSASCVIMLDPSWNPAADHQAIDRVHRIGQVHSEVFIFRLITCGTVEEKMYRNQIFKSVAARQATLMSCNTPTTESEAERKQRQHMQCFFTRIQLRNMFVAGDFEQSETASQLSLLHPHLLLNTCARSYIRHVDQVCALSDHSHVLPSSSLTTAIPTTQIVRSDADKQESKQETKVVSDKEKIDAAFDDKNMSILTKSDKKIIITEPPYAPIPVHCNTKRPRTDELTCVLTDTPSKSAKSEQENKLDQLNDCDIISNNNDNDHEEMEFANNVNNDNLTTTTRTTSPSSLSVMSEVERASISSNSSLMFNDCIEG